MNDNANPRIHWLDLPALVLFVALAAVVLLQFLSRYVLNDSVAWTEEIARYLLIGVAYAGSVAALRKGEHIFLEVIYRYAGLASVKPLANKSNGAAPTNYETKSPLTAGSSKTPKVVLN